MANQRFDVEMGMNSKGFDKGLSSAKAKLQTFAKSIGQSMFGQYLGAQGVINVFNKILNGFKQAMAEAKQDINMARLFGGSTEFVQQLRMDAEDAGTSLESLTSGFGGLSKAIEMMAKGGEKGLKVMKAFAAFGISPSQAANMNLEQIITQMRVSAQGQNPGGTLSKEMLAHFKTLGFITANQSLLFQPIGANQQFAASAEQTKTLNQQEGFMTRSGRFLHKMWLNLLTGNIPTAGGIGSGQWVGPLPEEKKTEIDSAKELLRVEKALAEVRSKGVQGQWQGPLLPEALKKPGKVAADFILPGATDSLARVGGYIGRYASFNPQLNVAKDHLRATHETNRILMRVDSKLGSGMARSGWE